MRSLNPAAAALQARALAGELIPVVPLVHMDTEVPQRWAICAIPLTWGGHTWQPLEIAISAVSDNVSQAESLRFALPGVTESQLALALSGALQGRTVHIYLAWADPDTAAVADAVRIWTGEMDMSGWEEGSQATVQITADSRAAVALRPRAVRYTHDDQLRIWGGDISLNIDPLTDAAPIVWPAASYFRK